MPPLKDLTGKQYRRLIVIEKTSERKKGSVVWKCRCECGSVVHVPQKELQEGGVQSCGCLRKEYYESLKLDITGQQYGFLTAMKPVGQLGSSKRTYWQCLCKCGNIKNISIGSLTSGNTMSCGCSSKAIAKMNSTTLKEKTNLANIASKKAHSKTGIRGVYLMKNGKYRARIMLKGKSYFLGDFHKLEDAVKARKKAEEKLYKPLLEKYNYKAP